jgi:outer membrane protein assembly factor BamB
VTGKPAISSDGTIYITTYEGYIYAISVNGTILNGLSIPFSSYPSDPVLYSDERTLYVTANNNKVSLSATVVAIDVSSVSQSWTYQTQSSFSFTVLTIASDGSIWTLDWDNFVYHLTPSGSLLETYQYVGGQGGPLTSMYPVISTDGKLFIGAGSSLIVGEPFQTNSNGPSSTDTLFFFIIIGSVFGGVRTRSSVSLHDVTRML